MAKVRPTGTPATSPPRGAMTTGVIDAAAIASCRSSRPLLSASGSTRMPIVRPSTGQAPPSWDSGALKGTCPAGSSAATVDSGAGMPSASATRAQSRPSMFARHCSCRWRMVAS